MTNRTNLRRKRSRQRRRDDLRIEALLGEAARRAASLADPRSAYDLALQLESPAARHEVLAAIESIVRRQLLYPLTTYHPKLSRHQIRNGVQG